MSFRHQKSKSNKPFDLEFGVFDRADDSQLIPETPPSRSKFNVEGNFKDRGFRDQNIGDLRFKDNGLATMKKQEEVKEGDNEQLSLRDVSIQNSHGTEEKQVTHEIPTYIRDMSNALKLREQEEKRQLKNLLK